MSEADDIKEFMGHVKEGERATQEDVAEVQRQLAEITKDPNLTVHTFQGMKVIHHPDGDISYYPETGGMSVGNPDDDKLDKALAWRNKLQAIRKTL